MDDDWAERKARLQKWIDSPTSPSQHQLKIIAEAMGKLPDEHQRREPHVNGRLDFERLATNYLCQAIHAGAFNGDQWLVWRTMLHDRPHILNAFYFLSHAPKTIPEPPMASPHMDSKIAVIYFADLIESFIKIKPAAVDDGGPWHPSLWFTRNTVITSDQLRQAKHRKEIRARKSKGQNLYSHADAISLWGEDAIPKKP